jgi:pilus assembly protein CpaB
MRMSNAIMIAIALVCATAAALFTRVWLVNQSAQTPAKTETAAAAPSQSIVVAAKDFVYGEKLTAETVKLVPWGGETPPRGAFLSTKAMFGAGQTQTALHTIYEGEPILQHKLVGGGASGALSARINSDMKAATIRVSEASGVSGLIQPDDRVDVFLSHLERKGNEAAGAASSIVVLLQDVRVLALDQNTQRKDNPASAKTVTLEVTTEDAQRLHLGERIGELSLVLNRVGDTNGDQDTKQISTADLIAAGNLTLPPTETTASVPAVPSGPTVTVTRSTTRENYQVENDAGSEQAWRHEILRQDVSPAEPGQ